MQYTAGVQNDPWTNTTPWADIPTLNPADNRNPSFGASTGVENRINGTYYQNNNSNNPPHYSFAPSPSFEMKEPGHTDPWINNNPPPGPPTDHSMGTAIATDIRNRSGAGFGSPIGNQMPPNEAGSNIDARAMTDSIVGKLYIDTQYPSQQYRQGGSINN
jgi:hypothetical protein